MDVNLNDVHPNDVSALHCARTLEVAKLLVDKADVNSQVILIKQPPFMKPLPVKMKRLYITY